MEFWEKQSMNFSWISSNLQGFTPPDFVNIGVGVLVAHRIPADKKWAGSKIW